jgi:hypothetical protein
MNFRSCGSEEYGGDQRHRSPTQKERKAYMFAREVVLQLKPNVVNELPVTFEKEKREVEAISLWESKEYAETYNRELYPQIEKIMARFIEGIPVVKKFEAKYSTFHKAAFATTH